MEILSSDKKGHNVLYYLSENKAALKNLGDLASIAPVKSTLDLLKNAVNSLHRSIGGNCHALAILVESKAGCKLLIKIGDNPNGLYNLGHFGTTPTTRRALIYLLGSPKGIKELERLGKMNVYSFEAVDKLVDKLVDEGKVKISITRVRH